MPALKNITGCRFGRLLILSRAGQDKYNHTLWLCACDCGNKSTVTTSNLRQTKSCGCYRLERSTRHGMAYSPTYRTWHGMKRRCLNPKDDHWKNYGGRGIGIDDPRWLKFENFLADMGQRPLRKSLDRINNNEGYSKANCRWASPREQRQNQRPRDPIDQIAILEKILKTMKSRHTT